MNAIEEAYLGERPEDALDSLKAKPGLVYEDMGKHDSTAGRRGIKYQKGKLA